MTALDRSWAAGCDLPRTVRTTEDPMSNPFVRLAPRAALSPSLIFSWTWTPSTIFSRACSGFESTSSEFA